MSLVTGEKSNFQFILRLLNTNVRLPLHEPDPRDHDLEMRRRNGHGIQNGILGQEGNVC